MAENAENTFYITTPIYYVNDVPHIGHAYTTIIADAISRFKKTTGAAVFFMTGTDEHGQKVEKAAAEKGMTPIELADKVVVRFENLWKALNIDYDYFIRTTRNFHEQGIQLIFKTLKEGGDIYKGTYEGFYCISDEYYLPEEVPFEKDGTKICPDCGKKSIVLKEESYFFRLSEYQDKLLAFYEKNPAFVRPQSRMNEVVSFVRSGLKDLSITRTTVKWGVPVPDDPAHSIYVWFDALHNYVTGAGYDWNLGLFLELWPADVHLIGKDILRFHAVFWPAFLMASGFELPRCVYGHGWWLKDETKMSKSKGNVLDPHVLLDVFGPDPLRYFLLREIPIGLDGNFSHEGFIHRVNSDLANDLGNLVQRTLTMIQTYLKGEISEGDDPQDEDIHLEEAFERTKKAVFDFYSEFSLNRALEEVWAYIGMVNKYLADSEPWKVAKDPELAGRLRRILHTAACAIRAIAFFVYPVIPQSAEKIWEALQEKGSFVETGYDGLEFVLPGLPRKTGRPEPLFPRVDLKEFLFEGKKGDVTAPKKELKEKTMATISYPEFKKMDLRVAKILEVEKVAGADKLLKLKIDLGTETRQIVAGIAQQYASEELVGKKAAVIVNLEPAVIRGIESQGMILAANVDGKATLAFYPDSVPTGAPVI
ncbi:MAG: methionine--tRNA ligase [Acidobacteria bacterium]|nr:methionine--tRNA ligase [Acidobacteriota bacterium]MBU4494850.1 methionine--tRNA ligase [Acidobacteriota bacterium]